MERRMKGVTFITRKRATYWYARVNGERVYCGKGDRGRKLAEAARAKEVARRYEYREMAAGLKVKRADFKTVLDMANWYMELPTIQEQKGYPGKVARCVHLLEYFGNKPIGRVEADDQERYRMHRKAQGAAEGTVDVEIALLSHMYHLARRRKKISAEAMPGEFVTKNESNPRRIITAEEFEKLFDNADPDFADFLVCGYESAMRSGEICNLRANQVHIGVRHISGAVVDYIDLGIFDTKTGIRRTVPIGLRLKEVLERRLHGLAPDDHIFTYTGRNGCTKTFTPGMVSQKMRYLCNRAKIVYGDDAVNEKGERIGVVFHCLRHTRTTKWVEMGFSDEIIRRATGHRSLEAYQQYVKLDPAAVMRLVNSKRHTDGIKSAQSVAGS